MPNVRREVDDDPADFMMLAKLNLPFDDRRRAIAVLQALQNVQAEKIDPSRVFAVTRDPDLNVRPQFVVGDLNLNLLVGFGLRFFRDHWARRAAATSSRWRTSRPVAPSCRGWRRASA